MGFSGFQSCQIEFPRTWHDHYAVITKL